MRASNSSRRSSSTCRTTGHEPIDCGAFTYDAEDDYPAFCIAAAEKTVADPDSLGIVIGGSGNGEQIAANKVPGARCALAWSVETASLAREHNNAQLIGIGGRMHTVEEALAIVDAFLTTAWSKAERHQRRIDILAEYERTHVAPPVPGAPPERMPEGHTLHRLARLHQRRFGRAPVLVSSPQGRFVDGAPPSTAAVLKKATAWGKHLFHHYDGGRVVHVHLGLYGTFTEVPMPHAAAGRSGADADGRRRVRHRSARADGVRGDRGARDRRRGGQTRARTRCAATPTARLAWARIASRAGRSVHC